MTLSTRIGIVAACTVLAQCGAPPAYALGPPPVDDSRLPTPHQPAPEQPTVQRAVCSVPLVDSRLGNPVPPAQLAATALAPVWQLSRGAGQRVAVIDTGVSPHRRLPRVVAAGDYVAAGDGAQDCDGHGTLVAGIIAATPDADGFSGLAPEATILSIRQSSAKFGVTGDSGRIGVGDVDTMAKAVRTAADLGAAVINISVAACLPADSAPQDRALGAALAYAVDVKDVVVVAAAGDVAGPGRCPAQPADVTWDTATVAVSPAWYADYVLTVGSVDSAGAASGFSLAGPWLDVAAPGEAMTSLSTIGDAMANAVDDGKDSAPISGTGYAAAVVSGLAALVRSRFPALTAREVMARIKSTAQHPAGGWTAVLGDGVVDPVAAVSTDAAPATGVTAPDGVPIEVPVARPAPPAPSADRPGRSTAMAGAAICAALLLVCWPVPALLRRRRLERCGGDGVAHG